MPFKFFGPEPDLDSLEREMNDYELDMVSKGLSINAMDTVHTIKGLCVIVYYG